MDYTRNIYIYIYTILYYIILWFIQRSYSIYAGMTVSCEGRYFMEAPVYVISVT